MTETYNTVGQTAESGDGDEALDKIKLRYRLARDHSAPWKRRTRRNYEFWAGRQWDKDVKKALESTGRAALSLNRIRPRVSAVVGMEIGNRKELRFEPREYNDQQVVDVINRCSEWTRDQAETEDHETHQFQDSLICGMGWSETLMDYEENIDGMAIVKRRNPMRYDWDPAARYSNLADMEYYFYTDDVSKDEFKALFPKDFGKASRTALGIGELWNVLDDSPHDAQNDKYYPNEAPANPESDQRGAQEDKYRLVKYCYIERIPVWRVMLPDGTMRAIEPDEADKLSAQMLQTTGRKVVFEEYDNSQPLRAGVQDMGQDGAVLILPYVEQMQRRHREAWITGNEILDDRPAPCPYSFSDHCMTGWLDENEGTFFGMVDGLIDPQEWSNKFFSQAIYIYTVNPKGGVIAKKKAVDNPQEFEEKYASPDTVLWASNDADFGRDFLERRPGQYPTDLDKLTAFAIDSLPALDGLTPEIMGTVARDQPGILENMRKQASMTVLAPVFDSKARYHKRQGRSLLHYISQYFTDVQIARIVGAPIDPQTMQAIRSIDVRNYDVIVADAPSSPNAKEYNLSVLMELMRQAPQVAIPLLPLLIKNSPLELGTQQEIMQALQPVLNPMANPQVQKMQQDLQKLQAENAQLKTGAQVSAAKMQADGSATTLRVMEQKNEADARLQFDYDKLAQEFELRMREIAAQHSADLMKVMKQPQSS